MAVRMGLELERDRPLGALCFRFEAQTVETNEMPAAKRLGYGASTPRPFLDVEFPRSYQLGGC